MTRRATPSRTERLQTLKRAPAAAPAPRPHPDHPELEHVPTILELAARGLARPMPGSAYRLEPEGQELIYAAMARNAAKLRADPYLRRRVQLWAVASARA